MSSLAIAEQLQHLAIEVDELRLHPRNPREGDVGAITESLAAFGQTKPVVAQRRDDGPHIIVAGNHLYQAARALGWHQVAAVVLEIDDQTALRYLIADNRTQELGITNMRQLGELLTDLAGADALAATGYDGEDVDDLLQLLGVEEASTEAEQELAGAEPRPSPRQLPLDAIFTITPQSYNAAYAMMAVYAGLKVGTQSGHLRDLEHAERWSWRYGITFVDNAWDDYDHSVHIDYLARCAEVVGRPKYATVRDMVTKKQAAQMGVKHYTIDQTLRMAEDVARYVEHPILIPKYPKALDEAPAEYVLGYSVTSSYGATPLPAERFRGRQVHLLGGSWANQLRYLQLLGEDVVSLDFNQGMKLAAVGSYVLPDGGSASVTELPGINVNNIYTVALALSMGHIGQAVYDLTTGLSGEALPAPAA